MKRLLTCATVWLCALCTMGIKAQDVLWDVDFATIFDNREGESEVADAKTFFLTQLTPQIGLSLLDGEHTVMGGITWTQPIGCEWDGHRISPVVYYRYYKNSLKGLLGMFTRDNLYRDLPNYIWNDSIYYVQKTVRGAAIMNRGRHGYFQAILDWRGMQTKTQREAFNVIAMGEWEKSGTSLAAVGGIAMINHLAKTSDPDESQGVVDNLLVNPYLRLNFDRRLPAIHTFYADLGLLASVTRDRVGENKWKSAAGFHLDTRFRWRWFALRENLYVGAKLFPYYHKYGATLDQGEPYYSSRFYSRTEVQGYIIDKPFICLKASLDFHATTTDFIFYQRLILNIRFDGNFTRKK